MPRQSGYKRTKNTSTFCCYYEHNGHDGEKCITLRDHIEALAREGKIDQFLLHPSRDNRNQRQVNVIYSINDDTPISESSNRAMKNIERVLRSGHQVFTWKTSGEASVKSLTGIQYVSTLRKKEVSSTLIMTH
ncbi:hypothetical protein ACFXTI_040742 [Malus domestica]